MTGTAKQCRSGRSCEPTTFVEAVDCLAHHSENSLATIAERIGRDPNYLRKAASQYDTGQPWRGDLTVPVTLASADDPRDRNLVLVRYQARAVGCALVVLPTVAVEHAEFFGAITKTLERVSDLANEIHESLRDNRINDDERVRLVSRTQALHEEVARIDAMVTRHVEANKGSASR
ncbi:MAG: phage regulatory CII family protein [Vicinamibacterales bacterium]